MQYRNLKRCAIWISVLSIVYNGLEGAVSIAFGAESSSRALVFFGIQSGIEVISAIAVLWRFSKSSQQDPGLLTNKEIRMEKLASGLVGTLLVLLALATEATAIYALITHKEPDASNASLIISASALVIMVFIWLPKRYLARALNSSVMYGEAVCSLSCIQITCVLFTGSLIFRLWKGGWWVDSATALLLGVLFGYEGFKMIRWVLDPAFDGGCCDTCHLRKPLDPEPAVQLPEQYRDLCPCCEDKEECKSSGECKCGPEISERQCCSPRSPDGSLCCTHKMLPKPKVCYRY
ncbi:hypothetical protein C8J56DRAFT_782678 [Mycena floridula]|nr:hypothetical protein C8J56DRAFT_782678 [Mycena floridula]